MKVKTNLKMTVKKIKKHARAAPKHVSSEKKIEKKTENNKKVKNGKTLLIAQEVKFARLLASNDKRVRDKVLKNLKKWLTVRSQSSFAFTETDFLRLWKGLFYCMWMSDKPLVQEDLAESLSKLVHCFDAMEPALIYTKCTLKSLAAEWFGIDQYRVDKFQMLVRKVIRQTFVMCKNQSWNKEWVVGTAKIIEEILLDPKTCLGLSLHITDLYMEELAKISEGEISTDMVTELIRPFIIHLVSMTDLRQIKHVIKNVFRYLILQSDVGMDYTEKFNAWRNAGFPCQSIDEMQKMEMSDDDDVNEQDEDKNEVSKSQDKPLDPRAGRVDVEIPQIPFDAAGIAKILKENKFHKSSTAMTRKQVTRLIKEYTKLHKGDMPFGIKEIPLADATRVDSREAAEELLNFEDQLYQDSVKRRRKKDDNLLENSLDELENSITSEDENDVPMPEPKKKRKLSGNSNWSVDENVSASTLAVPKKAKLAIKKTQKKKLVSKKIVDSSKAKVNVPWLAPVLTKLEEQNKAPATPIVKKNLETGSTKKKVKIVLQKNMSQNTSEYIRQILKSPGIPYDASKKPKAGVLKPSPLPSPINPFYKNKIL